MKKLLLITILSLLLCNKAFSLPKCKGEDISKWNMCKGIKKTSKGSKYTGEFKDGKRHGQGTFTLADGSKEVGKFKDGNFVK